MFVRNLTLKGFKSFADRTLLEFTPGISVVVGPNGSGKSNVVDAVTWVLGSQGARVLRASESSDMIYAGSPVRRPQGLADVRLLIDNSSGLIPVPAPEIEIGRTLYRTGESEYRLGGRPCRLTDIQEMLSDTGLGRTLHSIVGQGQVERVLQARPDERRQFIEEAAGIAKHRRRRERAERKLAGMEQDLLRLRDMRSELGRQLKSLEQQAELAARHEELTAEAESLSVSLAAVRLAGLIADRERRASDWFRGEEREAAARRRQEELDVRIRRLEQDLSTAEEAERSAAKAQASCLDRRSAAEAALRAAIRREAGAREALAAAGAAAARASTLREELERSAAGLRDAERSLGSREPELAAAEEAYRLADDARREAEDLLRRATELAAGRRAEAQALERSLAAEEQERTRLVEALGQVERGATEDSSRCDELEAEVERLDAEASPVAEESASLARELEDLGREASKLEARRQGLEERQKVLDARRRELGETPGAAFARSRGERPLGLLRELIRVPEGLGVALEAALGPFADAVVYASAEEAVAESTHDAGAGLLLAVAGAGGEPPAPPSPDGARPILAEVRPSPQVRDLVSGLLGRTFLAADRAAAVRLHRAHQEATFVSPDGFVVGRSFVRTPARMDVRVERIRRESASLERELAGVRAGLRERRARIEQAGERLASLRERLTVSDAAITSAAEEMSRHRSSLAAAERERELTRARLRSVEMSIAAATDGLARLAAQEPPEAPPPLTVPARPQPPIELRVEVESLRRERARLSAGLERIRRELDGLADGQPIAAGRSLEEAERSRSAAEAALEAADAAFAGAAAQAQAAAVASRRSRETRDSANRDWREVTAEVDGLRAAHEEERAVRSDLTRRIADGERELREGHGVDPAAAVERLGEEDTASRLERRAELVARKLELIGRVNLLATDELESIRERHQFLSRELDDVRAARRDLMEVIAEVDRRTAEMFREAFDDVAREFESLYTVLSPGGEGRLSLDLPDDPLSSGVEIEARPAGKRVKRLSLLSGGERSVVAIAFLFAIFRARPSPFYLMDEVEAALDDVNLDRFLDAIRMLAERSQVILVTHQKRTMEMGDALYGVSMGRDGASRVVTKRLAERGPEDVPAPVRAEAPIG